LGSCHLGSWNGQCLLSQGSSNVQACWFRTESTFVFVKKFHAMERRFNIEQFVVACILDFVAGTASGYAVGSYEYEATHQYLPSRFRTEPVASTPLVAFEILGFAATWFVLRSSGIVWGTPDMGPGRLRYHFGVFACLMAFQSVIAYWYVLNLFFTTADSYEGKPAPDGYYTMRELSRMYNYLVYPPVVLIWASIMLGARGIALLAASIICLLSSVAICIGMTTKLNFFWYPGMFVKVNIIILASYPTRYLCHQRLACSVASQALFAYFLGYGWAELQNGNCSRACALHRIILPLCLDIAVIYFNVLLRRRTRFLPPALSKAKFIRIGYLRRLRSTGGRFHRCQDLPEEAFGDAEFSKYLLIVSHRWFHPYFCDTPQGVKLQSLCSRLDEHFIVSGWRLTSPKHSLSLLCVGGWDVVIFFDFLSIPQCLQITNPEGDLSIVQRTPAEQAIFISCLPSMGTLYSTFPVVVLDEVPDDTEHNYIDSGWCTCEFHIAMLCNTLPKFSAKQLRQYARPAQVEEIRTNIDEMSAKAFEEEARLEIESKRFLHESDRVVAIGIVHAFMVKRLLADAIRRRDIDALGRLLRGLRDKGLLTTLDEPVDSHLNTLLHVAVDVKCAAAVEELLRFGADVNLRNLRGDVPSQIWAFPRISKAASLCRRGQTSLPGNLEDAVVVGRPEGAIDEEDPVTPAERETSLRAAVDAATQTGQLAGCL